MRAIIDLLEVDEETATSIAVDLEKGIFEKVRKISLGKEPDEVVKLEFQGEKSKEELRKEIMDTTKRSTPPITTPPKKTSIITPGSRSQLLEQLQVLGNIPNDVEIEARLSKIQEQISTLKKQEKENEEDNTLQSNVALKSFMFGDKGKTTAQASAKTATYSVAPTRYNIDPYREMSDV